MHGIHVHLLSFECVLLQTAYLVLRFLLEQFSTTSRLTCHILVTCSEEWDGLPSHHNQASHAASLLPEWYGQNKKSWLQMQGAQELSLSLTLEEGSTN